MKFNYFYIAAAIFMGGCSTILPSETKVVSLSEIVRLDTCQNYTYVAQQIVDYALNCSEPVEVVFPQGEYNFYANSKLMAEDKPTTAFELRGVKDLTISGSGSQFIFHGKMNPFNISQSEGVTLSNFSIDWERPYNSQAQVVNRTPSYVDMKIDKKSYPYYIEDQKIIFKGEGWEYPIIPDYTNAYDGTSGKLLYRTRDVALGFELFDAPVEEISEGIVRFRCRTKIDPPVGTILVFFHGKYITDGIKVRNSKDTEIRDLTIYHTLSCGVSAYKSENILLENVSIVANVKKGRVYSTIADATHFNGCSGLIKFENCEMSGAGDDFMNIHSMYARITEVVSDSQVRLATNGRYVGFEPSESAWCVDSVTLQRVEVFNVLKQDTVYKDGVIDSYLVTLEEGTAKIKAGQLLENRERTASLEVRNCRMYKKNRARSILVTTPKSVVIEDNYFNSAGSAILIEGDTELWYESGAVEDVVIRNNVFDNCYSSGDNIENYPWGWGEGVISITPSVRPASRDEVAYHHNILIENNKFYHFDYAVLYARSVDNLVFRGNELVRTYGYRPYYREYNFFLDGCRNSKITGNEFDADFLGKNLYMQNMRESDVDVRGNNVDLEVVVE